VIEIKSINPISSIILPSFASPASYLTFSTRFIYVFERNLTPILATVLIVGIVASLLIKRKMELFVISAFSIALFLYAFPETFAYRYFKEFSIMEAFVMAIGLWYLFKVLVDSRKRYSTIIFSTLIMIILLPSLIIPVYQRSYEPFSLGQSILSDYEYSAAQWLKDNTPQNSLLISDFVTMQLMAPMANKILPIARSYRVAALTSNDLETTSRIKDMLARSNFSYENANYLLGRISSTDQRFIQNTGIPASNGSVLIIITPRTQEWAKQTGTSEVWYPAQATVDESYIESFAKNPVELIYSYKQEIYVFKTK
jgi:hypothetical protein